MNKKIIAFVLAGIFATSMVVPAANAATLEEQIASLSAMIVALQAEIAGQTAGATAVCFDADLQKGMTSDSVKDLQIKLSVTPTSGYFGPITLAAVKTFQTSNGIINTGYVGPLTRGALNALYCTPTPVVPVVTYPAGCTATSAYSSTTGLSCAAVVTLPTGCTATSAYSSTTGLSCAGTTTTTVGPAYGTLDVTEYPVSAPAFLYGGTTSDVLAAQFKATGSDIDVKKVAIRIQAASLPWKDLASISLWDGSTKLAETAVTQANLIETAFGSDYTLNIAGLNWIIPSGISKVTTIKVTTVTVPTDTISYTFTLSASGIVYSDTAGVTYTSVTDQTVQAIIVTESTAFSASITPSLATDNPLEGNVIAKTDSTVIVDLYKFNIKAENVNVTFMSATSTVTSTSTPAISIELWDGSTLVASQAAPTTATGTIAWSNITLPVSAGTTKTLIVKATIKSYPGAVPIDTAAIQITGVTLTGLDANSNIKYVALTTSGNSQHVKLAAPIFALASAKLTVSGTTSNPKITGDAKIVFSVTAGGNSDIYLETGTALSTSTPPLNLASSTFASGFTCTSGAVADGTTGWRITSGSTATCELNSTIELKSAYTGAYYQVQANQVKWGIAAATYGNTQAYGWDNFKTGQEYLAY